MVCILHTYCWRLIQPVKMYVIWYMMWYLEKDMFCKEHIFSNDLSFLKWSVRRPFYGRSGRRPSSSRHVPRGTRSCICAHVNFYDRARDCISRSRARSYERSFQLVQGLNPGLACDLFCGSRVQFPDLAAWSFCGSRVQFPDPIIRFWARSIRGLCHIVIYITVAEVRQHYTRQ